MDQRDQLVVSQRIIRSSIVVLNHTSWSCNHKLHLLQLKLQYFYMLDSWKYNWRICHQLYKRRRKDCTKVGKSQHICWINLKSMMTNNLMEFHIDFIYKQNFWCNYHFYRCSLPYIWRQHIYPMNYQEYRFHFCICNHKGKFECIIWLIGYISHFDRRICVDIQHSSTSWLDQMEC